MANKIISVDTSKFTAGVANLKKVAATAFVQGVNDIASEILRLSTFEVPHDTGQLQGTGGVEPEGNGVVVGYNKVYAARLHEHPEYHFQKGRKGKYLEDPIKNNMDVFIKFMQEAVGAALS